MTDQTFGDPNMHETKREFNPDIHDFGGEVNVDLNIDGLSTENVAELTNEFLWGVAEERGLTSIKAPVPKVPGDLRIIGGFEGELDWWCQFEFLMADKWKAHFLDEADNWTELFGEGETPKAAFDSLVQRYKIMNGGTASYLMRRLLPKLESAFTEDGVLHPSILSQLEITEAVWEDA